jgi:hypothetical protein
MPKRVMNMFAKILTASFILNLILCHPVLAQNSLPVCEDKIKLKYSGDYQDRYGNRTSERVSTLNYHGFWGAAQGPREFGNNNKHIYVVVVDKIQSNQIRGRDTIKLLCITDLAGKFLGLEDWPWR